MRQVIKENKQQAHDYGYAVGARWREKLNAFLLRLFKKR